MQLLPGFGNHPNVPPPPPPPPKRQDPEIAVAKKNQASEILRRKGRRSTILTSGLGLEDQLGTITRPQARSAALFGG